MPEENKRLLLPGGRPVLQLVDPLGMPLESAAGREVRDGDRKDMVADVMVRFLDEVEAVIKRHITANPEMQVKMEVGVRLPSGREDGTFHMAAANGLFAAHTITQRGGGFSAPPGLAAQMAGQTTPQDAMIAAAAKAEVAEINARNRAAHRRRHKAGGGAADVNSKAEADAANREAEADGDAGKETTNGKG